MNRWGKLLVVLFLLGVVFPGAEVKASDPYYVPPDPGSGSSGGSCSYCRSDNCGCAAPQPGQTLSFGCACSSIQCTRECNYY